METVREERKECGKKEGEKNPLETTSTSACEGTAC
jgi:hypothetical protein